MSRHTQNSQSSISKNNSQQASTTSSNRPRPSWVSDSVNLPSSYRVTMESADPRVDLDSSYRR